MSSNRGGHLCQGLSFDEVQVQFNESDVGLISVDRESEAGREVIYASTTRTNIGVIIIGIYASTTQTNIGVISITNDNDNVGFKLHNSLLTLEVLSDSLFNSGELSGHQFTGDLSESHVHKLSDSHASFGDDLSLLSTDELSGLSKCKLSGFSKCDDLSPLFKCDDLSLSFKSDDLSLSFKFDDPVTLPFVLSGSASSIVSGNLSEVSTVVRDLVESDSDLSALMSDDLEDTNKKTTTAVFNKHVVKFVGNDEYVQDGEDGEVETPKDDEHKGKIVIQSLKEQQFDEAMKIENDFFGTRGWCFGGCPYSWCPASKVEFDYKDDPDRRSTYGVAIRQSDQTIVGVVTLRQVSQASTFVEKLFHVPDVDECYVDHIAVTKNARGMGVGTQLLNWADEKARERGATKITLRVVRGNPAKRLY
ncbi:hypothetical protein ACHAWO_000238 [Cyclotella atomus]|uniref:N-acetyltransferase domain-containing protein n=1 Tax=Cyclotella atomus TaxID=382360 RepID=A0ABD3Q251_9STRA